MSYSNACKARCFEEEAARQYDQMKIPGVIHSSLGQEAVAAGVCGALRESDYIISGHRGHGHVIAKGTPARKLMAELMGRATVMLRKYSPLVLSALR